MAKKGVDMTKLTLGAARPVVKTEASEKKPVAEKAVEQAVEAIHDAPAPAEKASKTAKNPKPEARKPKVLAVGKRGRPVVPREEESVRVSVDLPKSLYKRVKMRVVEQEITLFEYFARLAEADLAAKK